MIPRTEVIGHPKFKKLDIYSQAILMYLLIRRNDKSGQCNPSLLKILSLNINKRTLLNRLKKLSDEKWIEKTVGGGRGRSTQYLLSTPGAQKETGLPGTPVYKRETGLPGTPDKKETGLPGAHKQGYPVHHERERNEKNIYIRQIFDYWNSLVIIKHRRLTQKIFSKISARLKDYSIDEIWGAIKNYHAVLEGDCYFWSYKWNLITFLKPDNLERFLSENKPLDNFRKQDNKKVNMPSITPQYKTVEV